MPLTIDRRSTTLDPRADATRREFILGGLAASVLVGACSSSGDDSASSTTTAPDDGAEPVEDSPATANVLALDEIAGLAVLSVGVQPAQVDATFSYTVAGAIFESEGITIEPANPAGVNLEAVAAFRPSAIIGVSIPTTAEAEADLDAVAPTTVLDFSASWQDQLAAVASALGTEDQAAALQTGIEADIDTLRTDLADAGVAGRSVSVIADSDGFFALSRTGLVGSLLSDLGLTRPAPQDVDTDPTNPFVPFSEEQLPTHDAEVIILFTGSAYPTENLESSPLWTGLEAVQADGVIEVSAELWFSSSAFGVDWIVKDLRAGLLSDGTVATDADAVARWEQFSA